MVRSVETDFDDEILMFFLKECYRPNEPKVPLY